MTSLFEFAGLSVLEGHILAATIRGTLIVIVAAALCISLRRASAAVRHFVWFLALTALLALPLLSSGLPSWRVAVLPAPAAGSTSLYDNTFDVTRSSPEQSNISSVVAIPVHSNNDANPITDDRIATNLQIDPRADKSPVATISSSSWVNWALLIWLAGALLFLSRLLIGIANSLWISRRAPVMDACSLKLAEDIAVQIGLTRKVPILKSSRTTMPVTCGVIRPRILFPVDSDQWPPERLKVVLLHELAHVKRWDCLTQLLAQTACCLYWFNPLVWLASRNLRVERERACDDQVIDLGTKASDYAGHLLDMARMFKSSGCSSLATLAIARRSQLEGRLLAILDPDLKRRGLNRMAAVAIAAVIFGVVLPLATVQLSAHSNDPAQAKSIAAQGSDPENVALAEQPRAEQVVQPASKTSSSDNTSPDQEASDSGSAVQQKENPALDALREGLKDDDPGVRQQAIIALSQAGDEPSVAALLEALTDPNWQVRANAAWALGLRGGRNNVDALVAALKDTNWQVREQAAWALGLKGDARSVEPLVDALKDESLDVREKSAWALGLKGDRRSVDGLIEALKDPSPRVRGMGAWALGLRGDSRAGDALKDALKDQDKEVRQKAAWAFGMLLMKLGGAPVGVPDADGVDGQIGSNRGVSGGVSGGVQSGVPGGVPGGVQGGVSRGVPGGVPSGVSGGVHGGVPSGVSKGVPGGVPSGVSGGVSGGVPNGVSRGVPGGVPGGISGKAHFVKKGVLGRGERVGRGAGGGTGTGIGGGVSGKLEINRTTKGKVKQK